MTRGKYIRTEEIKKKNRDAVSGEKHRCFGKHLPLSTREKIGLKKLGKKRPDLVGSLNPAWKGGTTPEVRKVRTSTQFKLWRNGVFERDDYTCQKYGTVGGNLVAHHILNFSSHEKLRFDINNGITLSKKAHDEFHKIYGKIDNTRKQLLEFLSSDKII